MCGGMTGVTSVCVRVKGGALFVYGVRGIRHCEWGEGQCMGRGSVCAWG